jgi:hypothetical protein
MRADRDKRAVILTAEGMRQSAILTAEGEKQSAILMAEGDRAAVILRAEADRQSRILRAQGEGQAIETVFQAIHDGSPDQALLAYQYLQMLPKIAQGDANKVWIVPSEIGRALEGLGSTLGSIQGIQPGTSASTSDGRVDYGPPVAGMSRDEADDSSLSNAHAAAEEAIAMAQQAAPPSEQNPASSSTPPGEQPGAGQPRTESPVAGSMPVDDTPEQPPGTQSGPPAQ